MVFKMKVMTFNVDYRANRRAGDNGGAGADTDTAAASFAAPAASAAHSTETSLATKVAIILDIPNISIFCSFVILLKSRYNLTQYIVNRL